MPRNHSGLLAPSVTARDPKGLKFVSIVEAAYNKANLSDKEAQRVNEASGLSEHVAKFIAENRGANRFKDEEARSSMHYPKEYKGPKPIAEQIKALAAIFDLDPATALEYAKDLPELPQGAEGWFAVPSIDALARKHFLEVSDPGEKYCRAIQLVLEHVAASRPFYNWRNGQVTPDRIRLSARTASALAELAEAQKGDILVVAAQLGMRHRGRSTRRAREVFVANEFGLGAVSGGSIALTHPERLVRFEELDMDLPGDEFDDPDSDDRFDHAPCLFFYGGKVKFAARWYGVAHGYYGSASGFLPQK